MLIKLDDHRAHGYDLIIDKMLKYLQRKTIVSLTPSSILLSYFPLKGKWLRLKWYLIFKNPANETSSGGLVVLSKLFEKILLSGFPPIIKNSNIIHFAKSCHDRADTSCPEIYYRLFSELSLSFPIFLDIS